ncbi:hypothetical protein AB2523_23300, partial [Klebsiella michiganensis]|uniref:hypothetical protein n=1 Tax=Klebsiella michiganensis TaxID=1134687 RepID=UPI003463BB31
FGVPVIREPEKVSATKNGCRRSQYLHLAGAEKFLPDLFHSVCIHGMKEDVNGDKHLLLT